MTASLSRDQRVRSAVLAADHQMRVSFALCFAVSLVSCLLTGYVISTRAPSSHIRILDVFFLLSVTFLLTSSVGVLVRVARASLSHQQSSREASRDDPGRGRPR